MKSKNSRTTLRIQGSLHYELLRINDDWQPMETCHCVGKEVMLHKFEVQEIGYKFRKLVFGGTFKEACEFLEAHAKPFTPLIIRN